MEKKDPYTNEFQWSGDYRHFDNLPKIEREALAHGIGGRWAHNRDLLRRRALQAFGKDHPQAQGYFLWPLKR